MLQLQIEVPEIDKGWPRLSGEISIGNTAALKVLFKYHGVDPNLQEEHGYSLLHSAVHKRSEVVVKLLMEKEDVNVNIRDNKGRTPLWEAVSRGYKAVVELLLDSDKVDPDAKDDNGRTPLFAAVMGRSGISLSATITGEGFVIPATITAMEGIVELLLASGRVDPDAKDARGLTPLAWVSRAGDGSIRIAEMLLSTGGVDANSKNSIGITPLLWTAPSHNDKMQNFLLSHGKLDEDLRPSKGSGDIDSRYITHWINSCDAQHGTRCKPASLKHKSPQRLPHWVIDVGRECLVPGYTVPRYVALSYVWSQNSFNARDKKRSTNSILLKKLNLSAFQKPGHLKHVWSRLPTAVKDAILLVRRLKEIYLWVDCLCIVQDDEKTRDQVDHMGDIYSGAYFTIIAATHCGQLSSSWVEARGNDEEAHMYDKLYGSKWATRGWTFQEQMLSKRAIVFTDRYMFWECQQDVWSPDGPRPEMTGTRSATFTVPHYEKASRMLSSCYPDFDLYTEMISLYNSRMFTYPQDVLPAFSGILTTLAPNFPSGFQYGLPRVHLDIALLWQPFRKTRRRVREDKDTGIIAPKTHLPSWSWCGWTCPVDPYHLRTRSSYFSYNNRASEMPVWRTQKLVQWYCLPEDMHCQVPADGPLSSLDRACINIKDDKLSNKRATRMNDDCRATEGTADTVSSAAEETALSPPLSTTPHTANPESIFHPHDSWPFLSCQTSCMSLYIEDVHYSLAKLRGRAKRNGWPSIFKLPQFAEGRTTANACDLICLGTQEGLTAGTLRHMEKRNLQPGDAVELIAVSTGTVNSTGIEGDEEDKLYRLVMKAPVGSGMVYSETSEYLGQYNEPASIPSDAELINH